MSTLWNGQWDGWTDLVAIIVISAVIALVRVWIERRLR